MSRWLACLIVLGGCTTKVSKEAELCAKAATMFETCESFDGSGSDAALTKELMLDRWRGLCRAVLTGETAQLMSNARELYEAMDAETRAGLRAQAECTAKTTTCAEYVKCEQ
jgi:hypothetical protein